MKFDDGLLHTSTFDDVIRRSMITARIALTCDGFAMSLLCGPGVLQRTLIAVCSMTTSFTLHAAILHCISIYYNPNLSKSSFCTVSDHESRIKMRNTRRPFTLLPLSGEIESMISVNLFDV